MILFFGSRIELTYVEMMKEQKVCPYCKVENHFKISSYRKYQHLFFIPVYTSDRFSILACSHCKKSFETEPIVHSNPETQDNTPNITQEVQNNLQFWKTPFGMTLKLMAIVVPFFLICNVFIKKSKKKDQIKTESTQNETDIRKSFLSEDLAKMEDDDYKENSKIGEELKQYVSESLSGIETSEIKYFTKINNDKLLVLVKVGSMKGIESSSRKKLVYAIETCLNDNLQLNSMKQYIGVNGNWNMLLVKTPTEADLSGKFADESLLLSFYGQKRTNKNL